MADGILQKGELKYIDGNILRVKKPKPMKCQFSSAAVSQSILLAESRSIEPRTIEVRGFTKETVTEQLELYFENKNRSGGGQIEAVDIIANTGIIVFKSSEGRYNIVFLCRSKFFFSKKCCNAIAKVLIAILNCIGK